MSDKWDELNNQNNNSDDFDWDALFNQNKNSDISEDVSSISESEGDDSLGGTKMFEPVKGNDDYSYRASDVPKQDDNDDDFPIIGDDFRIVDEDSEEVGLNRSKGKRPSSKKKPKKKSKLRKVGRVILSIFLVCIISVCLFVGAFMFYIFTCVDDAVDNDLYDLQLDYTTILYATNDEGKQVELTRLHADENRVWVSLDEIPVDLQKAFISAEDKNFEEHNGVDWKRTFAALLNEATGFLGSQQGGSTITQQLVKNLTADDAAEGVSGYMRKVREIMRARYLETNYYKDDILAAYLNTIHLGHGVDGVEVASYYYFDKHASELSLVQCAALAAITKAPADYDPYTNPEENKTRRNWVLTQMLSNGYITAEECEEAKNADLELREDPQPTLSRTETVDEKCYSWFVDTCIEQVIQDLSEKLDCSYQTAESKLFRGGYKIYTTQDIDIQNTLEGEFMDDDNFAKVVTKNNRTPQAAMTVMDYEGHVLGIVGGRGEKDGNRLFNRATNPRQTGSAIKPIAAYAPAIEYNIITYGSSMVDEPVMKIDGKNWPVNYTGYYSGRVTVLHALEQSMNTIPVKLVQKMGLQQSFDFVTKNMGITTYVESEEVNGKVVSDLNESSLALGGASYGCSSIELTAAYATLGNLGYYYKPMTYTKVTDHKGEEVILQQEKPSVAMSEGASFVTNKMLQRVTTNGTGKAAAFGNWDIISKTGTTTDTKDRWFVAGTPYYVSAVWFGIDENEAMTKIYGGTNPALRLWKAVFTEIHKGLKAKEFPETDDAVMVKYCTTSGMVANSGCSSTAVGWFKSDYAPVCTTHRGKTVDWSNYDLTGSSSSTDNSNSNKNEAEKTTTSSSNGGESQKTTSAQQSTTAATTVPPTNQVQTTQAPSTVAEQTQAP